MSESPMRELARLRSDLERERALGRRLRAALLEYADHADDSGWKHLAAEIRRRVEEAVRRGA